MKTKLFVFISLLAFVSCGSTKKEQVLARSELRTIEVGSRRFQFDSLATRLQGSLLVETIEMREDAPVRYQRATLAFVRDGTQVTTSADTLSLSGATKTEEAERSIKVKEPPDLVQKMSLYGFAILLVIIILVIYKQQKK